MTDGTGESTDGSGALQLGVLRAEIVRARECLTETRRRRMALQRASVSSDTLERAIADARRDRDAGTSAQVEEARDRAERLIGRLMAAWRSADVIRLRIAQLGRADLHAGSIQYGPELLAALAREAQLRANVAERLTAATLTTFTVPQPVPTLYDPASLESPAGTLETVALDVEQVEGVDRGAR